MRAVYGVYSLLADSLELQNTSDIRKISSTVFAV